MLRGRKFSKSRSSAHLPIPVCEKNITFSITLHIYSQSHYSFEQSFSSWASFLIFRSFRFLQKFKYRSIRIGNPLLMAVNGKLLSSSKMSSMQISTFSEADNKIWLGLKLVSNLKINSSKSCVDNSWIFFLLAIRCEFTK